MKLILLAVVMAGAFTACESYEDSYPHHHRQAYYYEQRRYNYPPGSERAPLYRRDQRAEYDVPYTERAYVSPEERVYRY